MVSQVIKICHMLFNGKDRTEKEWRQICDEVGLQVKDVHIPMAGSSFGLIEVVPK